MSRARNSPTKLVIQDATLGLFEHKDAARITVADIIKAAYINRSTFYYHYQGKDSVIDDIVERATRVIDSITPMRGASEEELAEWFDTFTRFVEDNRHFFRLIILGGLFPRVTRIDNRNQLDDLVMLSGPEIPEGCDPLLFVQARACAIGFVLERWLVDDCRMPREEIMRLTWAIFRPHSKPRF